MGKGTVMERYGEACRALPADIRAAEAEGRREKILSLTVKDGGLAGSGSSDVTTVSVRAAGAGGGSGFAFTQKLEDEPLTVLREAAAGGALGGGRPAEEEFLLAKEDRKNAAGAPVAGAAREGEAAGTEAAGARDFPSVAEGLQIGAMVEGWARAGSSLVAEAEATVSFYETENWVVNSAGLSRKGVRRWTDVSVDMVLQKEGAFYNASWYASLEGAGELRGKRDDLSRSLRRSLAAKGAAVPFASGVYRVLLSREAVYNIMITLWQAFSGRLWQRENSFLCGRMGEKAASGLLSICDAPAVAGCGYGRALDSEGVWAREHRLLTDGVVTGRLHNLASAAFFGEEPTGNAGRAEGFFSGLPTGVTAIPNICYICAGTMGEEEMLSRLGDGVWITETYDPFHSIQIGNGDFAIPCNGVRVVGGKPAGVLNSLTITGNLAGLLQEVEAVGDTVAFRRFYTGLYYLGGPELLVGRLQVNG